jgi:hypothetical protein
MLMANYPVKITLVDNRHAVPIPGRIVMHVGDTIQYEIDPPNLGFKVEFDGTSPFASLTITSGGPHELLTAGRFFCKCFLTKADGVVVGWKADEEPVESGGDHDIRP